MCYNQRSEKCILTEHPDQMQTQVLLLPLITQYNWRNVPAWASRLTQVGPRLVWQLKWDIFTLLFVSTPQISVYLLWARQWARHWRHRVDKADTVKSIICPWEFYRVSFGSRMNESIFLLPYKCKKHVLSISEQNVLLVSQSSGRHSPVNPVKPSPCNFIKEPALSWMEICTFKVWVTWHHPSDSPLLGTVVWSPGDCEEIISHLLKLSMS